MIDAQDAQLLLEIVSNIDRYLSEAKVPSDNPDRIKHSVLSQKLQDTINSPQIDAFTVEEVKQLRILVSALMARIGGTVKISITDFIQEAQNDPDAYKLDCIPDNNGTEVTLKWTGTVNKTFATQEFLEISKRKGIIDNAATLSRGTSRRNP